MQKLNIGSYESGHSIKKLPRMAPINFRLVLLLLIAITSPTYLRLQPYKAHLDTFIQTPEFLKTAISKRNPFTSGEPAGSTSGIQ